MKSNSSIKLLDISNNKAKAVLYSLAKRHSGKLRIETYWRHDIRSLQGKAYDYPFFGLFAYVNGLQVNSGTPISLYDDITVWLDEDKLDFCRRNKYKFILTRVINCTSQMKDVYLGTPSFETVFTKRGTTLEQLLIENDLTA